MNCKPVTADPSVQRKQIQNILCMWQMNILISIGWDILISINWDSSHNTKHDTEKQQRPEQMKEEIKQHYYWWYAPVSEKNLVKKMEQNTWTFWKP